MNEVATISDKQVAEAFDQGAKEGVRDKARKYTDSAIRTLASIMRNTKNAPGVRRAAAMNLLDQAWGRPDARGEQVTGGGGGITIVINKLSTGEMEKVQVREIAEDVVEAAQVVEALKADPDD